MNRTSPILGLLAAALLVLPITPCLEDGARHMLWQVEDCTCHEFGESRSEVSRYGMAGCTSMRRRTAMATRTIMRLAA